MDTHIVQKSAQKSGVNWLCRHNITKSQGKKIVVDENAKEEQDPQYVKNIYTKVNTTYFQGYLHIQRSLKVTTYKAGKAGGK